ncbi:MAG: DUF502 domain-containing protein [Candidatus Omnitrophota bacterium]|nr:DUF502 domain-containing protein [Candidatus Omnitrophota bacterium]
MSPENKSSHSGHAKGFQFYLVAGIFTVIPLLITFWVIQFVFNLLSKIGSPMVTTFWIFLEKVFPPLSDWITPDWLQSVLAVTLTLTALYFIGRVTTHVLGLRLIRFVDSVMDRIPFAKAVYGNTKKLLATLQRPPGGKFDRVVLLDFPTPGMKAVGFLTAEMADESTGEKLAAVFVPTTPNPTSGYLEIVPYKNLVVTGWRIDEAMQYIISGGAGFPEKVRYFESSDNKKTKGPS